MANVPSLEDEDTFVTEPPDDLHCPICLHVLDNPYQTSCGHRFCLECIEAIKNTSNPICPIDRMSVEGGVFQDNAAKMQIRRLKIYCPYHKKGCKWIGDLADKASHLRGCLYSTRTCTKCDEVMLASKIESHQEVCPRRSVNCSYCNETMPFNELDEHTKVCPLVPVKCPNHCQDQLVLRHMIPAHLNKDCPRQPIQCRLASFGCSEKVPRAEMNIHLKVCAIERMPILASVVLEQSQEIDELKKTITSQQATLKYLELHCYPAQPQFTWRIDKIREKIEAAKLSNQLPLYSPAFFSGEGGYKLGLCIFPAGDNNQDSLSLYFSLIKGPFDEILPWPFQKRVCLFLINCRGGPNILKDIIPDPRLHYFRRPIEPRNVGYGYPKFIPTSKLLSEDSDFVANGAIFIRVLVLN